MARNTKGQFAKKMTAEEIRAQYMENLSSIAMLHTKNAALVDELRKLGFDFYDAPKEPQEDMSDPNNWRVGDLVKIKDRTTLHSFAIGQVVKLKSRIDADNAGNEWEIDSTHPARYIAPRDAVFHSRASK